ncbi:MAG: hypothetical protein MSG64_06010 [Pyrinomonadaceae bacterium MAG19_C2-C3]|nr:hypothetical protein [Pyrinomonadaceae bacterium MAG19_C2-C3]
MIWAVCAAEDLRLAARTNARMLRAMWSSKAPPARGELYRKGLIDGNDS